jgi:hypothetical protein
MAPHRFSLALSLLLTSAGPASPNAAPAPPSLIAEVPRWSSCCRPESCAAVEHNTTDVDAPVEWRSWRIATGLNKLKPDGRSASLQAAKTDDATWDLTPTLLRGTQQAQISMYGSTPDVEAMVASMKHHRLGRAFDPVGTFGALQLNSALVDVLLAGNLSYVSFYGGADCQVSDGDTPAASFTPASVAALRALNASTTVSVQFGEYGYYFHCLQESNSNAWWHIVYPTASEFSKHQHDITPVNLSGFRSMPTSHAEAYSVFERYVQQRRADYQGWMFSMLTGHGHYSEMFAARWGAGLISLEVGADVASSQSKMAFARGSSRRHRIPWSLQVSPWLGGSCTSHGPVHCKGRACGGAAAGHSLSFVRRMVLQAWFAGAALITPENSVNSFFSTQPSAGDPGVLSTHGQMAQQVNAFILSHDRGVPYTPVLVLIDEFAGYSNIPCKGDATSWGIFTKNSQANETRHLDDGEVPADILRSLFEQQIWPRTGRGLAGLSSQEETQLRPTPFGELVDVGLSDTPARVLAAYETIVLAGGDIDFARQAQQGTTLAAELVFALSLAPKLTLLLQPYHVAALSTMGAFAALNATSRVEVLGGARAGQAITNARLGQLRDDLLPFNVSANVSVQWQVNKLAVGEGWLVSLVNNDGVSKPPNASATLDAGATSAVELTPHFAYKHGVWEWRVVGGDVQLSGPGAAGTVQRLALAPGTSRFLHFKSDDDDERMVEAEFSLGAYVAAPGQNATLVIVRHVTAAQPWPALDVAVSLHNRATSRASPPRHSQPLRSIVPRGKASVSISIPLRGWLSAEYTTEIYVTDKAGQAQSLIRWLRVERHTPPTEATESAPPFDLTAAMSWPDAYHHKAFEMSFVDDHWIAEYAAPMQRRVHRGTPIRITNQSFDIGPGFVHEHQSSNLVGDGAGLAINISVTWGGSDGAPGPLFTCEGYPGEQCHFYECKCANAATGCRSDSWTCHLSSPPAVQHPAAKTAASSTYRRYSPSVDGPIPLAEVKMIFAGYHQTKWGSFSIPAMSTWATWSPRAKGVTLLLSDAPLTTNRVPRIAEPGNWNDTNDNFGGQWVVTSNNVTTLFYSQARMIPRYPPYNTPYGNAQVLDMAGHGHLVNALRILVIWRTTDGQLWTPSYFDLPLESEGSGAQQYGIDGSGATAFENGRLQLAFVEIYNATEQRTHLELRSSRDGQRWARPGGDALGANVWLAPGAYSSWAGGIASGARISTALCGTVRCAAACLPAAHGSCQEQPAAAHGGATFRYDLLAGVSSVAHWTPYAWNQTVRPYTGQNLQTYLASNYMGGTDGKTADISKWPFWPGSWDAFAAVLRIRAPE